MICTLILSIPVIGQIGSMTTTRNVYGAGRVGNLHEAAVTRAERSVVAHVAAAIFESRRLGINLPNSIPTGYKTLPAAGDVE